MSTTPPPPPLHWVLDWDGTLTQHDTLSALVSIAARTQPGAPILQRWKSLAHAYIDDFNNTFAKLTGARGLPGTLDGEATFLKDLEVVERRSLTRVHAAGIFAGVTKEHIEGGAKKALGEGDVVLRAGVVDFLARVKENGERVHVLSVNWSRHFIHSCLAASNTHIDISTILTNELDANGRVSGEIVCSGDKVRELESLRRTCSALIVYVGDSWTDIECLLAADVGICIRDELMGRSQVELARALERLGVRCGPLAALDGGKGVVWARDFVEIERWADRQRD